MPRFPLADLFSVAAASALLAGAVIVQTLTHLPSLWVDAALAILGLLLAALRNHWRWFGFILLGTAWTLFRADAALSARLPLALEGEDIVVSGTVRGLPRVQDDSTRFDLVVGRAEHAGRAAPVSGLLRLSWYENAPSLLACERWQLHVRLKRPRGLIDPGGLISNVMRSARALPQPGPCARMPSIASSATPHSVSIDCARASRKAS